MSKQKKLAECVFKKGFVTETVDPQVDRMWKAGLGVVRVPFGDLRNMWRRHHCRTLNPYGDSERCPYPEKECASAFLDAIRVTVNARPRVPVGYFIKVAKGSAAKRADEAVERRASAARLRRTDVPSEPFLDPQAASQGPPLVTGTVGRAAGQGGSPGPRGALPMGDADRSPAGDDRARRAPESDAGPGRGLPRRGDGPISVGDLLRRVAPGPRQDGPPDRSEGTGR